jgi:molybdenum cofactor cytidylyltransferase
MDRPTIALAILAAGASSRFDGRKLEALLDGEMLGTLTAKRLASFNFVARFAVYDPTDTALAGAFAGLGFTLLPNGQPNLGLSYSIIIAAQASDITGIDALLVCLADMPNVPVEHIVAMVDAFDGRTVASLCGGVRMPPALFPRGAFAALTALSGSDGARAMLADAIIIEADAWSLADIDTREDLAVLSRSYRPSKAHNPYPS